MLENILIFLGGISVFILGIRLLCENCERLLTGKMNFLLKKFAKNSTTSFMTGTVVSAISQSSVAVNSALVSLVDAKRLSLLNACAVIVGVNVGTTITTQLISLTNMSFDMSIIACFLSFLGVIMASVKKTKTCGLALTGFGFIFIGLKIISPCAVYFERYDFFMKIFTVKNPFLLIFYGIMFPAILQSSSVLTGIMVILSEQGILCFSQNAFLILGANIGSCMGVILFSVTKNSMAKKCAYFNLLINVFGAVLFTPLIIKFPNFIQKTFTGLSVKPERQLANFHTLYNLATAFLILPFLKFFIKIINTDFKCFFKQKKSKIIDKGA